MPEFNQYGMPLNGRRHVGEAKVVAEVVEQELLRLVLCGWTLKECATSMRVSYSKVRKLARTPEFLLKVKEHSGEMAQRMMDELVTSQVDFAKKLEEASEKALDEMLGMMESIEHPTQLKVKICQDLMDRDTRATRTRRIEANTHNSHEFINPAVLLHAAATAKELERYSTPPPTKGELTDGDDSGHTGNS